MPKNKNENASPAPGPEADEVQQAQTAAENQPEETQTASTPERDEWATAQTAEAPEDAKVTVSPEEALQAEVASLKDQLLRKEADFQNYRKRMAKEIGDARRVGLCDTVTPFLQLFDLFSMAMKAADTSDNVAALKQGLAMILTEYGKALDELGVQKFDADGADFDPMLHDAVSYEHSADVPEGKVIKQWNCGYKLGEKLLRPARVIVSSGPESEKTAPENEER